LARKRILKWRRGLAHTHRKVQFRWWHTNTNPDCHGDSSSISNANGNGHSDGDSISNADGNGDSYLDAVTQAYSDSETSSDSTPAPVVL
jgi:hypothetical protein